MARSLTSSDGVAVTAHRIIPRGQVVFTLRGEWVWVCRLGERFEHIRYDGLIFHPKDASRFMEMVREDYGDG